ncbi:hypothetical protein GCM10023339_41400 [Alloalcanivorax gelatiniphagus]
MPVATSIEDEEPSIVTGTVLIPLLGVSIDEETAALPTSSDIRVLRREAVSTTFGDWDDVPARDNQILTSATHVVELREVTLLKWPQSSAVQLSEETSSRLDDFVAMLSLSAKGFVGYAEVAIMVPSDTSDPFVYSFLLRDFARRLDAASSFSSTELSGDDLMKAIARWRTLPRRHPSLRTAAQRLQVVWLREPGSHDSIVDLCIGIEALVGEGASELVNRISMRSAAMLATAGWQPSRETAKAIRDVYSYRSQVVHGIPGPYKKEMIGLGDGHPMHAVRFAMAALMNLLEVYFEHADLSPKEVDDRFIYAAFDSSET